MHTDILRLSVYWLLNVKSIFQIFFKQDNSPFYNLHRTIIKWKRNAYLFDNCLEYITSTSRRVSYAVSRRQTPKACIYTLIIPVCNKRTICTISNSEWFCELLSTDFSCQICPVYNPFFKFPSCFILRLQSDVDTSLKLYEKMNTEFWQFFPRYCYCCWFRIINKAGSERAWVLSLYRCI